MPTSDPPDIKASKAALFRAIAKFLGIASVALVPALAGWIDAKTKASLAFTAAASERATNEKAYVQLTTRLDKLEAAVDAVRADCETSSWADAAVIVTSSVSPRKRAKRPAVKLRDIEAAKRAFMREAAK